MQPAIMNPIHHAPTHFGLFVVICRLSKREGDKTWLAVIELWGDDPPPYMIYS